MGSYHMRYQPTLASVAGWNHVNGYEASFQDVMLG